VRPTGHEARIGKNLKRTEHLEELGTDGMTILEWILNMVSWCGLDSFRTGQEPVDDSCEHGNEPSVP